MLNSRERSQVLELEQREDVVLFSDVRLPDLKELRRSCAVPN